MRTRVFPTVLILIIIAVAVAMATALRRTAAPDASSTAPAATSTTPVTSTAVLNASGETVTTGLFRAIAKAENPVVVAITTQSRVKTPGGDQLFGGNDFFRRFFGGPEQQQNTPREGVEQALGSGFLVSRDGEILTNNHVVEGADEIRVALFTDTRRSYPAEVVGRDALTDSALIKLKGGPANLPTAMLGDSDSLEPGDWVMAIGNPFQLGHTVTVGVISFKGRPFATTEGRFQNMLQTDASINPGNSGGPLIDTHGNVVGVNTAILAGEDRGNVGIGFAVPINTVKDLLPQLRKGSVARGQLGVQVLSTPVTDDEARGLGLPKAEGAVVSRVEPGSPADRAGLRAGDVIVQFKGQAVPDANHLTAMVVNRAPNERAQIVYYRNGQQQTTTATIEKLDLEPSRQAARASDASSAASVPGVGLSFGDVTPDVASTLGLSAGTTGAFVQNVEPFTPAANAGIRPGDLILEVNHQAVRARSDAVRALSASKSGGPVFLLIQRQGVQQFVELRKE